MEQRMTTETTERRSHTIGQWCAMRSISRPFYYKLKSKGLAPREMRVLGKILITDDADSEWQHARQAESVAA
jgi:hypothetical protein